MEKLKTYIMIDCYAFTVVALINSFFISIEQIEDITFAFNLNIFGMTSLITVLILITDIISKENSWICHLLHLIDIIVPVVIYDMMQEGAHLSLGDMVQCIIICSLMYLVVYTMMYISWKEKDHKANEQLEKMRKARANR